MPFKVIRTNNGREFPNGDFDTKAEAEKHAEYVRKFHGKKKGADVRVEKCGAEPEPVDEDSADEADETPDEE
jgi:hypothetical protein